MIAFSASRFLVYFFTKTRRFSSRLIKDSFAILASVPERKTERGKQRLGFGVGLRGRGDRDVHPAHGIDLVVLDLRENDLFLDTHVEVAAAVERPAGHAAKVAYARQRDRDQPVEEFVHAALAQRDHAADRIAFADLEDGDGLPRLRDHGLLPADLLHVP